MWGKRKIIYLSPHCHHQSDSCIKMGSDERHVNVSFIMRNKVTRQCPENHKPFEEKGEPKRYRTVALLLNSLTLPIGQSGSRDFGSCQNFLSNNLAAH